MSKKPVSYIKPQDPSFLVKLKKEAGYSEGPTIDTKKEKPQFDYDSDNELDDEQPVVLVLKDGDLTAEEAERIAAKQKSDKESEKADLSQRVLYQKPSGSKRPAEEKSNERAKNAKTQKKDRKQGKQLLSFDEEDE